MYLLIDNNNALDGNLGPIKNIERIHFKACFNRHNNCFNQRTYHVQFLCIGSCKIHEEYVIYIGLHFVEPISVKHL